MKRSYKSNLTRLLLVLLLVQFLSARTVHAGQAPTSIAETVHTLIAGNVAPTITTATTGSGLVHPGVGLTKDVLINLQNQVRTVQDPWASYFVGMSKSSFANTNYTPKLDNGSGAPKYTSLTSTNQWMNDAGPDAQAAFTQAIMYLITGNESYRTEAMRILRLWGQVTQSPSLKEHIKSSYATYYFASAAELMKYSSAAVPNNAWTSSDNTNFGKFLHSSLLYNYMDRTYYDSATNTFSQLVLQADFWMNQHDYALLGAMSVLLFEDDAQGYANAVEMVTVNSRLTNNWGTGSIKMQAREVGNGQYQFAEMGRDQPHASAGVIVIPQLCQLVYQQGTKVDPTAGTVSTAANAVNAYEFLGSRLLFAADHFAKYNLGYTVPWTPIQVGSGSGNPTLNYQQWYNTSYNQGRGHLYNVGFVYNFFKYLADNTVDLNTAAPNLVQMYKNRYQPSDKASWENTVGGEFWLYMPAAAANDANINTYTSTASYNPGVTASAILQVGNMFTAFAPAKTKTVTDPNGHKVVEMTADSAGTTIAALETSFAARWGNGTCVVSIRFKTSGIATLELKKDLDSNAFTSVVLPDTQGQWKYTDVDLTESKVTPAQYNEDIALLYFKVSGSGATVTLDALAVNRTGNTTPNFGMDNKTFYSYVGGIAEQSFAATNASSYSLINAPAGATIDSTGKLTWTSPALGTYTFYIQAKNTDSVAVLPVTLHVESSASVAESKINAGYNSAQIHTTSSLNNYNQHYSTVHATIMNSASTPSQIATAFDDLQSAIAGLQLLTPLYTETLKDGTTLSSINYPGLVTSSLSANKVTNLLDVDPESFSGDLFAPDNYFIIDFGANYRVKASAFWVQNRRYFPTRTEAATVYASNDNINWVQITDSNAIHYTDAWQSAGILEELHRTAVLSPYTNTGYRFFKIAKANGGLFSISELRIEGKRYETVNAISSVSISTNTMDNRAAEGDQVILNFVASSPISNISLTIEGNTVTPTTSDGIHYSGTWNVASVTSTQIGKSPQFALDYTISDSDQTAETILFTTDDSKVFLSSNQNLIDYTKANYIDPSANRTPEYTATQVGYLSDKNISTGSDFRLGSGGAGSYIAFDFGNLNNVVNLSRVEVRARQGSSYTRINGAYVQGSNDGTNWTTLTSSNATSTQDWQKLNISSSQLIAKYRYIRLINNGAWYGNMSELRLFGIVSPQVTSGLTFN